MKNGPKIRGCFVYKYFFSAGSTFKSKSEFIKRLPHCNIVESVCVNHDRAVGRFENPGVPVVM